ncbi:MAG TPA: DUF4410 domain-containing protein [Geminicoccaceae bacterium]|nr:DUF4410 domain-containing protein [Geminicoccaceae bacterium]
MRIATRLAAGVGLLLLAACASTEITSIQPYQGDKLARPGRILVEDFVANPADVPAGSTLAAQTAAPSTPPTAAEVELGRKLGAEVAAALVADLKEMGLPAVRAAGQAPPAVNDIVLRGYFLSVDPGSARERVVVGFGAGAAELKTAVEGFQMTPAGLRRLGGGEVASGGGKVPGVLVPLAVVAGTGNPIGLVVGGAAKAGGEMTGSATIEGAAKRTADEIMKQMRPTIERQGWT